MRIAIYSRTSTQKQDTENQLVQLREFAAKQNWQVTAEYVDNGCTGGNADREQFQKMFADASQRKFDLLLFWSLDRLSREGVYETLTHLNRLTSCGVEYKSFTEQFFDSCGVFRDAVISIMAVLAKQEKVRLIERTKAGLAIARAKGRRLGRPKTVKASRPDVSDLRALGFSWRKIGKELGISPRSAQRLNVA